MEPGKTNHNLWKRNLLTIGGAVILLVLVALLLAWISTRFQSLEGWVSFLVILVISLGILIGGWFAVKADRSLTPPRWLLWLLIGAMILRLGAGIFWYLALPVWGYGSQVERAGYVMSDAFGRDVAAWELASSEEPLINAFSGYQEVDQYGGLLYLSAVWYRYLGGASHMPLQMVVLSATVAALAVLFGWAFTQTVWEKKNSRLVAWIIALFPDAILLGSSQMREAFLMTLVASACYGLAIFWKNRGWRGLIWILISLGLILPLSPPIAGVVLLTLVVLMLSEQGGQIFRQHRFWLIMAVAAVIAIVGIWLTWKRIAPQGINNPLALISWWLSQASRWQAYFAKRSSQLIRRIFKVTPGWSHTLILMGYGILQPFLPATLMDSAAPIWKGIVIWRSLGWTILLAFLLISPILWGNWNKKRWLAIGMTTVVWLQIMLSSLRGGGDPWDNPRYRVVFISLQAALAAWVYVVEAQRGFIWLRRIALSLLIIFAWFVPWYLGRAGIISWPITDVFKTLGLGMASAVLYLILDWVDSHRLPATDPSNLG